MINIVRFSANPESPATGYWDHALLDDILANPLFKHMDGGNGAIVIIPAPYQGQYIKVINEELANYSWVILILTSDEESNFPIEEIKHPNIKIYVQYPKRDRHEKYGHFPLGYTSETRKNLEFVSDKDIPVFYSAQDTHERRHLAKEKIEYATKLFKLKNVTTLDTQGFAQGFSPKDYTERMCYAKIAPAPSGPVTADSFRLYEALECGAVPIADNISPKGDYDYWEYMFGSVPFPTIGDYENLPGYINDQLKFFPQNAIDIQAWWIKKKRDIAWQLYEDIVRLSGKEHQEYLTVIIPVSPIKSHPSVHVLDETVESIRKNLPEVEIIITFDGVRKEQEKMRKDYEEFTRQALYLCNTKWNAIPIVFHEHMHQIGMARVALEHVKTPAILYVEQDTPLVTDELIDWQFLIDTIVLGDANVIRLHFEGVIPKEHEYLMIGDPENHLLKTIQWSQRPHLAATDFYRHMLKTYFSEDAKCFIEDRIHSVVQSDYADMHMRGWDIWKLFIYYPDPKNIKRSGNLDGREGEKKFDESQVF